MADGDLKPAAESLAISSELGRYLVLGLDSVEGWGVDLGLAKLFLRLNQFHARRGVFGNLLEIGVHHGRAAILLCLMADMGECGVFIDLFDRQDENIDHSGSGDREIFERNLRLWAPGRPARIVQANTLDLDFGDVEAIRDGVRFAHIDGAHYRAAVLNDLFKVQEHVCEGAVVIMDDFTHTGFPGVNEACNHYLEQTDRARLAPAALGLNKLILTTAGAQAELVDHIQSSLDLPSSRRVVFHGHEVLCLDPH